MATKIKKVYEGKTKVLYATDSPGCLIQYFKDEATAFNAAKRGVINQKGVVNNKISAKLFLLLESAGIPTHFERLLSDREMLIKKTEMIPLEVIIRTIAAGSLCRALPIAEGVRLASPILEYCYKDDSRNDPLVNEYHIAALGIASPDEIETMKQCAFLVNQVLSGFFSTIGVDLIDFKIEFGRLNGMLIVADEISPDTCRLWEHGTNRPLDKDRFRKGLDKVEEAYQEILQRVNA